MIGDKNLASSWFYRDPCGWKSERMAARDREVCATGNGNCRFEAGNKGHGKNEEMMSFASGPQREYRIGKKKPPQGSGTSHGESVLAMNVAVDVVPIKVGWQAPIII